MVGWIELLLIIGGNICWHLAVIVQGTMIKNIIIIIN